MALIRFPERTGRPISWRARARAMQSKSETVSRPSQIKCVDRGTDFVELKTPSVSQSQMLIVGQVITG